MMRSLFRHSCGFERLLGDIFLRIGRTGCRQSLTTRLGRRCHRGRAMHDKLLGRGDGRLVRQAMSIAISTTVATVTTAATVAATDTVGRRTVGMRFMLVGVTIAMSVTIAVSAMAIALSMAVLTE